MFNPATETDVERLQLFGTLAVRQMELLVEQLRRQGAELDRLRGQVEGTDAQLRLKGLEERSSERGGGGEPSQAKDPGAESVRPAAAGPKRGHGPTPQPVVDQPELLCTLDEPDQICPDCGGDLEPMAGQFESSEMVDVIDVQYVLRQVKRQKYTCRCGHVEAALGPDRAQPGGRYSLKFAIHVAVQKFLDHLPLTRQVRMMGRNGLEVTSQTLWDQLWALAELIRPTYLALWAFVMSHRVIGLDQTCWPNLDKRPKKNWQLWCLTSETASVYAIRDTKGIEDFVHLVGAHQGIVVCDDLGTHSAGARASPGMELAGCWAHIIRRFKEVEADFPVAKEFADMIRKLYEWERLAIDRASRRVIRRRLSGPWVAKMETWLRTRPVLMSTSLGGAIKHTLKMWPRLIRFVGDPDIWLDNNRTERGIRAPVVGRKNYGGCKSRRGTEMAAMLYSLVETAKLHRLNPHAYLLSIASHAMHNPGAALLPTAYVAQLEG